LIERGWLLKDREGDIYLVGDTNERTGMCNCCGIYDVIEYYSTDLVNSIAMLMQREVFGSETVVTKLQGTQPGDKSLIGE
jgi:hypothetical protein